MSDDAKETPAAPVPSAQLFARPATQAAGDGAETTDGPSADETGAAPVQETAHPAEVDSRFPGTGDALVDQAVALLPDPDEHRQTMQDDATRAPGASDAAGDEAAEGDADATEARGSGIDLPDPGLLDSHITEVTSVHRRLQQRLSDLSG